ncbi:DUF4225 domain-containing protein [Pseudomonas frederiksbergensis]|uniref:DUF4225 domain-containing protein n=1 Tax=Pseudomonas frederiksbergensis TaxID=104087 RepID=A0A423K7Q8_9PSED|nr:DUF4225 domain-containing protein [Pseudomonas frederiksbergensis]RON47775.1 hypothetical protein BK665_25845 [Pseudomonas frederiksbergensis]
MKVSEKTCDIHDVVKSASDLVAFGCSVGATQLYDSFMQIQFSSIVSSFANEIILAVDEGIISAQQGIQQIRDEYAELSSKALFYAQNGIGVLAGVMQIQSGASTIKNTRGINTPMGILYSAHGVNNIYEGAGNIYNGPNAPSTVGPVRKMYQSLAKDTQAGNIAYYSVDLGLSAFGVFKPVRKFDSIELFRHDPINYERAFQQMGRLTLAFEALVDAITIKSIGEETNSK